MTLMTMQVVLKQTHADQPVGLRTRQLFQRARSSIAVKGIITNGNTGEILSTTSGPIYHMGSRAELDLLVRRYRRDRGRIRDISDLDTKDATLIDTDFDPFFGGFETSVFQHWTNGVRGRKIYFDENSTKETEPKTAIVDRAAVISTYLVLSNIREALDGAFVNIVRGGLTPDPKAKEEVQGTLRRVLNNASIAVTGYTNGVRYYDIMISIHAKKPITQKEIGEMLQGVPRVVVNRADLGSHDIPKMEVDAVRTGNLRPPIIACITKDIGASTTQEIRLNTDPRLVVAAANMDATQVLAGTDIFDAMKNTDLTIGIRN